MKKTLILLIFSFECFGWVNFSGHWSGSCLKNNNYYKDSKTIIMNGPDSFEIFDNGKFKERYNIGKKTVRKKHNRSFKQKDLFLFNWDKDKKTLVYNKDKKREFPFKESYWVETGFGHLRIIGNEFQTYRKYKTTYFDMEDNLEEESVVEEFCLYKEADIYREDYYDY